MFAKNLKIALDQKGLSQKHLVDATDISKASISQYLSGNRTPEPFAQVMIAEVLGVTVEWLNSDNQEPKPKLEELSNSTDTKVSILEASKRLGVGTNSVYAMLQQNRVDWGIAWRNNDDEDKPRWGYHIARSKFNAYLGTTE